MTVIVPVSPIASHPSTEILEQTLDSVRFHLPDAELIVTFDGVRAEQADRTADYDEFARRALWLLDHKYGNALPLLFDSHRHQSGMMREALNEIRTPLLLYVEADCPLVTDEMIPWPTITDFILTGESNLVRLSHESHLLPAHSHMHHGSDHAGLFTRTSQYSARPHVASVAYYRRCLESYFTPDARSFLEDRLHGVVDEAWNTDGMAGWNQHRLHIYTPGGNIKRSYTLDGRAGESKFDDTQVF